MVAHRLQPRQQRHAMTVAAAAAAGSGGAVPKSERLFSFGLFSDVQVGMGWLL